MSVCVHANSSGIQLSPTPSPTRSFERTAIDESCFATRSGSRIGSLMTLVRNRTRSVTAAIAAIAMNGSTNGVSPPQKRDPSPEYG